MAQDGKEALTRLYLTLNPAQLKREITRCQDRLLEVGRTKPRDRRKEVSNPPHHPWKTAFSTRLALPDEDIFGEATGKGFEDILTAS